MTLEFQIKPCEGVGDIMLGQSRHEVLEVLTNDVGSFMKTPSSTHPTDAMCNSGFQVFYEGDQPVVESIELSSGCGIKATYCDIDVLASPVDVVLKTVTDTTGHKLLSTDGGYSYEIEAIGLWFWRSDNDKSFFDTVGVGIVGKFT